MEAHENTPLEEKGSSKRMACIAEFAAQMEELFHHAERRLPSRIECHDSDCATARTKELCSRNCF
jgi:hypothetical protein